VVEVGKHVKGFKVGDALRLFADTPTANMWQLILPTAFPAVTVTLSRKFRRRAFEYAWANL
jgi:hypothetical protein